MEGQYQSQMLRFPDMLPRGWRSCFKGQAELLGSFRSPKRVQVLFRSGVQPLEFSLRFIAIRAWDSGRGAAS
jgi:hypothetical protein